MGCGGERQVIDGCHGTRFTQLRAGTRSLCEPLERRTGRKACAGGTPLCGYHPRPVPKARELFTNAPGGVNTLPELASLTVIPAVQGLAGQKTGYDTWFDALAAMEKQMDACDYEVAIIGAGAYGLPLAAHARDTGHVAIQMSGATQLLFGIKGRRWDTHPQISKLYNPAWVRPAPAEQPANKQAVEGGSYW